MRALPTLLLVTSVYLNLRSQEWQYAIECTLNIGSQFAAYVPHQEWIKHHPHRGRATSRAPLHLAAIYRQANALQLVSSTHVKVCQQLPPPLYCTTVLPAAAAAGGTMAYVTVWQM